MSININALLIVEGIPYGAPPQAPPGAIGPWTPSFSRAPRGKMCRPVWEHPLSEPSVTRFGYMSKTGIYFDFLCWLKKGVAWPLVGHVLILHAGPTSGHATRETPLEGALGNRRFYNRDIANPLSSMVAPTRPVCIFTPPPGLDRIGSVRYSSIRITLI